MSEGDYEDDDNDFTSRKRSRNDYGDQDESFEPKRSSTGSLCLLKILVPGFITASLIGKKGSSLAAIKSKFGVDILLSKTGDIYPGTEDDRIMVLTGWLDNIADAHDFIIDRVHHGSLIRSMHDHNQKERGQKVIIICPDKTSSLVIGPGASIIKSIQAHTKAYVSVATRAESHVFGERTISIAGGLEVRKDAARQVASLIAHDPDNIRNSKLSYTRHMNNHVNNPNSQPTNNMVPLPPGNMFPNKTKISQPQTPSVILLSDDSEHSEIDEIDARVTVDMGLPNPIAGFLLNDQGETLNEIMKFSGAVIQFSKNDYYNTTSKKTLTIIGSLDQAQTAYFLVNKRIKAIKIELLSKR